LLDLGPDPDQGFYEKGKSSDQKPSFVSTKDI
jgi:hypothetical protein